MEIIFEMETPFGVDSICIADHSNCYCMNNLVSVIALDWVYVYLYPYAMTVL